MRWAGLGAPARRSICGVFDLLTREALDRAPRPPFEGLSYINADGLPLQWVLRFSAEGEAFGWLCEAGRPGDSPFERFTQSLERLYWAWDMAGSARPAWLEAVAAELLPSGETQWPAHWRSALWVGVGAADHGAVVKVYFNLNRDAPRERWLRAGRVLQRFGRNASLERLCELSGLVSPDSWPVGLAVDALPDGGPGRVKVYFRSGAVQADWLQRWYRAAGYERHATILRRGLELFPWAGRQPYPEAAFTVSLEFHRRDGELGLKTDFGITKWMPSDEQIVRAAQGLLAAAGAEPNRLQEALETLGAWPPAPGATPVMRFVGLGSEPDGSCHVNVYLEPPLEPAQRARVPARRPSPEKALAKGLEFLAQVRCGTHWRDFRLPVGESDAWVTAFVLVQLAELAPGRLAAPLRQAIEEALDWLEAARTPQGGWGYNGSVEDDADSTAWAILALRRHGRAIPPVAVRLLERCGRAGGGTGTYPDDSPYGPGWKASLPDVRAVAAMALDKPAPETMVAPPPQALTSEGLPAAYWWASPLYTCWTQIEWAARCGGARLPDQLRRSLLGYRTQNAWEDALLVRCLLHIHPAGLEEPVQRLLAGQQRDGGWPASAWLRLARAEVLEPWRVIDAGPLYPDHNGVFTTAGAVAALGLYLGRRSRHRAAALAR
jgi:hypothetical protein